MRELTTKEMQTVTGGFGVYGTVLGAIHGGYSAHSSGHGVGGIVASSILGGVSGFFGGISVGTRGFARVMFGIYSVQVGGANSRLSSLVQSH